MEEKEEQAVEKKEVELFIVRVYDGFDNVWTDVTKPVPYAEANRVWDEKTKGGTQNVTYDDIDYYRIFPANTKMYFS